VKRGAAPSGKPRRNHAVHSNGIFDGSIGENSGNISGKSRCTLQVARISMC
jgi:hypothetical protein